MSAPACVRSLNSQSRSGRPLRALEVRPRSKSPREAPWGMLGFENFRCARVILCGIALTQMIAKDRRRLALEHPVLSVSSFRTWQYKHSYRLRIDRSRVLTVTPSLGWSVEKHLVERYRYRYRCPWGWQWSSTPFEGRNQHAPRRANVPPSSAMVDKWRMTLALRLPHVGLEAGDREAK